MATESKSRQDSSPLAILTVLAVEGSSSLVEAQRTFLNLVQQENDILFNGIKERISSFIPAVAVTDLAQRSLDTVIEMQLELLTATSKQTLQWLESEKGGKGGLVDFAREGVETFTRAQKKFLEAVAEEAAAATGSKRHNGKGVKKTELAQLARDAGNAFIEAQKRLLDVMGQQMNVNLDTASRTIGLVSPSQLLPIARRTGEGVKNFFNQETSLIGSFVKSAKKLPVPVQHGRTRPARRKKAATV
ncbi:MAG TPA: hypothetical protein VH350_04870 [Candidatus Sulfotelmatobacter sp.]|jgi:hypothetical protein|nr:hypothetical protein [Candidatus Sulfotelmatobacter sp.]